MIRANRYYAAVLTLVLAGCSDRPYELAPVSGKVTLNGKPLPDAVVSFEPDGTVKDPGPGSSGETDTEGRFILATVDGQRGAVVGRHKVMLSTLKKKDSDAAFVKPGDIISPELVPEKYVKEPLTFDVPSGGTTTADLTLEGPPPRPLDRIPINPPRRFERDR
jgi:hypothetical protein